MSQPPPYVRGYSFTDFSSGSPTSQPPGAKLDAEYDHIHDTLAAALTNLAKIQRDDGALANGSVGPDQLVPGTGIAASSAELAAALVTASTQSAAAVAAAAIAVPAAATASAAAATAVNALGFLPPAYPTTAAALAGTPSGNHGGVLQASAMAVDTYLNSAGSLILAATTPYGAGVAISQKVTAENSALSVTQWPVTPTIYINPSDAQFNLNAFIPNRSKPAPTRDFLQFESSIAAVAGATLTRNYAADPWLGNTANRVQVTAGGALALVTFSGAVTPSEIGNVRLGFFIKSNTGAGAQSVKVGKGGGGAGGGTFNTTEGAWTAVDLAFSGLSNGDYLSIAYNAANADVLFTKPVLSQTDVKGTLQYVPLTGGLGHKNVIVPGSMTIQNASLVGPYDGAIKHSADGIATVSYSEMSMIAIVRKDSASTPAGGSAFVYTDTAAVAFGDGGTQAVSWIMPGLSAGPINAGMALDNAGYNIIGLKWNATTSEAWLNGVKVASASGANAAINTAISYYGGGHPGAGTFPGHFSILALNNTFLSDISFGQMNKAAAQKFALYGDQIGRPNFLIIMGDSISAEPPTGATLSYASKAAAAAGCFYLNYAVAGSTTANMISNQFPNALLRVQEGVRAGRNMIVSIMIGVNSPGTAPSTWQYVIDALVAAGARVIVCTITSTGINSSTVTNNYNIAERALTNCTICDIGANALLGGNTAFSNTTYFNAYPADPVPHPKQAGQDLAQTIFQPVLVSLML